ncbi:phosphonate ABC transporter ATP-binding protein [Afifella marina]|uniref:Phosphonate transport system ATP-binding protein n=1 Tax=Afifella marina DSM 2698 TaxID=1120955 RepID=A0A1G5MVN3_AFIMA|nr:phosphonate ABC transporter ATP-binding protein [Afifella marina]MBK1621990.1 phosphonate ABC transporter ATP-binding protein [Afifella marina DSM 2698]MBK1627783.1 phosphonate ABC transporter ATP-binding protein [Afifella marina]MBK5916750.1 phosphonate ABC transporter ATP-binding protein [Afifella marina]RAI19924.1 phosphonate ABC transporter ATP-binding protein [Afifella marina DSM 2698]SCZ28678.1 phosphonate transport system ATP-binding protein [Afifella marina DSM 2698]
MPITASANVPAVRVEKLSKRYGKTLALRNVSIDVAPGEMVALIGASGSGKSTLIRHIAGLERGSGDECRVTVLDRIMQADGRLSHDARRIRREIGVIFQQFNLVGRLSVLTNVLVGCLGSVPAWRGTLGLFTRGEQEKAMQALSRVGIAETVRQRSSTLSGGQQQRAAIARALVQGAKVILADEPISSLDPSSARRVMEALGEINRADGITVIVSLHQVEYARLYCPRTLALRDGEVAFDGPSAALTDDFLREIYGDASEELVLPGAPAEQPQPVKRPEPAVAKMARELAVT